jgi:hypothetical protein
MYLTHESCGHFTSTKPTMTVIFAATETMQTQPTPNPVGFKRLDSKVNVRPGQQRLPLRLPLKRIKV